MTQPCESNSWWYKSKTTLWLCAVLVLLNLGVFPWAPVGAVSLLTELQHDGVAIRDGETWRLLTSNWVHWNPAHFYLDMSVFLVLGLLYERRFGRAYPWLLLWMSLAIGVACFFFLPERTLCRGLSGVDWGLFAAALYIELRLTLRDWKRIFWVGPAAGIVLSTGVYQCATGRSFFDTEVQQEPMGLAIVAHVAGIVAALAFVGCFGTWKRTPSCQAPATTHGAQSTEPRAPGTQADWEASDLSRSTRTASRYEEWIVRLD